MRNKRMFKTFSVLCAALVLMGGFSVTAFAQGTDQPPAEDATNDGNVVVEETEDSPALTPEGNAALVDDFGGNKQLITVTTKAGNYFYILIDRANEDMVLYQMGDFFEIYGEDAKEAAPELELQLVSRAIPSGGRVEMCGFPANRLEQYLEQLRTKHDVTVSATLEGSGQRREYSVLSIDHEAEQDINDHEAEYGADGFRAFRDDFVIVV